MFGYVPWYDTRHFVAEKLRFDVRHQGSASAIAKPKQEEALFALVAIPR